MSDTKEKLAVLLDGTDLDNVEAVLLIAATKDGKLIIKGAPDNIMVAQYLISRAEFNLNVMQMPDEVTRESQAA